MSPIRPRPALACAALLLIVAATVSCQGIAPSSTEAEPASVDPDLSALMLFGESAVASTEAEPASVDPDLSTLMLFGESAVAYEEAGERIPAARSSPKSLRRKMPVPATATRAATASRRSIRIP